MKKYALPILTLMVFFTLSCAIMNEGIVFTDDEESNRSATGTAIAELVGDLTSGATPEPESPPAATSEPVSQSGPSATSKSSSVTAPSGDQVEYAVSATNNGCICTVSGNMTLSLDIQGDKLFYNLPDGTSHEYVKVSDNRYQKTYMGYYILVDSASGEETRVDEERHDVITLTESGFISEHYQGAEGSPCCSHTFTSVNGRP